MKFLFNRTSIHNKFKSPFWAKFVVIGLVVYVVYSMLQKPEERISEQSIKDFAEQENISGYVKKYSNLRVPTIKDVVIGSGGSAVCGQTVKAQYEVKKPDGGVIESATKDIRLGERKSIKALEKSLFGIKSGGERVFEAPAILAYDDPDFVRDDVAKNTSVTINIKALEINPEIPKTDMGMRVNVLTIGSGVVSECGSLVEFAVNVWDSAEKMILGSEKPITARLGHGNIPFWLETALVNIPEGRQITIVVPKSLVNFGFFGQKDSNRLIPNLPSETIVVDVKLIKVLKK